MEKGRVEYLDVAKGIGILLVLLGHSTLVNEGTVVWVSSYHMPLFFIVAGMIIVYKREWEKPFGQVAKKKCMQLLPAYVVFSIVNLLFVVQAIIVFSPVEILMDMLKTQLIQTVTLGGISVLWFLPALYFGELLFIGILKLAYSKEKIGKAFILGAGALLAVVVLYLAPGLKLQFEGTGSYGVYAMMQILLVCLRMVVASLFLMVGYLVQQYIFKREKKESDHVVLATVSILALLYSIKIAPMNGHVDMNLIEVGNPLFYILNAVIGSVFVLSLSTFVKGRRFFAYCGVNSLIIMATHLDCRISMRIIKIVEGIEAAIASMLPVDFFYIKVLLVILFMSISEYVIITLINRYVPFVVGKRK